MGFDSYLHICSELVSCNSRTVFGVILPALTVFLANKAVLKCSCASILLDVVTLICFIAID